MKRYLQNYESEFEKVLNHTLMKKEADKPLLEYIKDAWLSLEILRNIKIISFDYTEDESKININEHIFKRDKKKKKKERYELKFINDDRFGLLTVTIGIMVEELDPQLRETVIRTKKIKKRILIPLQDEEGYYHIKGKKYYMIYQMVDKSTYISSSSVTLKSLMPIAVKREILNAEGFESTDIKATSSDGAEFRLPVYNVYVFRKEIPIILFYLANGLEFTLQYLGMDNIISFEEDLPIEPDNTYTYFQISNKCYIKVVTDMLIKYPYVQSVVGGFLFVCTNRMTIDKLNDRDIWLKKLSNNNTIEKGLDILKFFNRLMDETTRKILILNDFNKKDIYAILRWMMQNFNELRQKDNLSLENKRLRCNEYIASLLTQEFSKRLNKVISLGNKATINDYSDMFGFSGDILFQKMHTSGILKFDDNMNDLDFFSNFKYTTKGPNSLGRKNSNNISTPHRGVHPSMIGYIDLLVCGSNDPGTSGILTPFSDIKGLYFNESSEPDSFLYDFATCLVKMLKEEGVEYIEIKADNQTDYYKILDSLSEFNDNAIKVSGCSKNPLNILVEDVVEEGGENSEEGIKN